jgi:hypothetical protein
VGLRDITGVFSRFFVVGFFVPSFFVVLTIAWLFSDVHGDRELYVVGGGALLVALVLVGLRDAIWHAFERHPWRSPFGDATFEYHDRVRKEWGLTVYWAWPFLKPFFNDNERELDVDGRSDVHFFLNSCLGAFAIAVGLIVDALSSEPIRDHSVLNGDRWFQSGNLLFVGLVIVALAAAYASYAGATSAVRPWGEFKAAAVVRHRSELYDELGIERTGDEFAIAERANRQLAPVKAINEQAPIVGRRDCEIAAAPDAVWNVLTTFARWRYWDPNGKWVSERGMVAERSEFRLKADTGTTSSRPGTTTAPSFTVAASSDAPSTPGRVKRPIARTRKRFGLWAMRSTVERVERVEQSQLIAWTGKRFGIRTIHVCKLDSTDGRTWVHIDASYEGLIARLIARRLFRGRFCRRVDGALKEGLEHLKKKAETERQAPAENLSRRLPGD